MKNNRVGLTYLKLILILIIIGIVCVGVGFYIKGKIQDENAKNLQSDLLLIQAKVEMVKGNYSMDAEGHPLKGYKLSELPEGLNLKDFFDREIILQEDFEKYFLLDNDALEQCGLGELVNKYDGYFIVSYDDFEVIYTNGYENINGLECFKLSELNKSSTPINVDTIEASAISVDGQENVEGEQENLDENNEISLNDENQNVQENENENNEEKVYEKNVFINMVRGKFPKKDVSVEE